MSQWSQETEDELILLIKDWLKAQGRTQADLRESLQADSARMHALIDALKKEFLKGGLPKVAARLCKVEEAWTNGSKEVGETEKNNINKSTDPFGQLDLLLEKIREDCES